MEPPADADEMEVEDANPLHFVRVRAPVAVDSPWNPRESEDCQILGESEKNPSNDQCTGAHQGACGVCTMFSRSQQVRVDRNTARQRRSLEVEMADAGDTRRGVQCAP